jgi:hypothetical protein
MNRLKILLTLLLISISLAEYKPLKRKERKAFLKAAEAVEIAVQENNREAIMRFAPGILKDYESVLLDPDSEKLREKYLFIEQALKNATNQGELAEITKKVDASITTGDYKGCITNYQEVLDYLSKKGLDSLMEEHERKLADCQVNLLAADKSVETLQFLSSHKYYDRVSWMDFSKSMESSISREFLELSASLDRNSIIEFKKKYPGLHERDVHTLLNKARDQHRLSILKNPSKDEIFKYYGIYPEKDAALEKLLEQILYSEWKQSQKIKDADRYLNYFPNSDRSNFIREWMKNEKNFYDEMNYGGDPK